MVSIRQLIAHVEHTLGGKVSNGLGGSISVVNAAGRHFHAIHPWQFTQLASVQLAQIADEPTMDLPADFGELVALQNVNSLIRKTQLVTIEEILKLRSSNLAIDGWTTKVATAWRDNGDGKPKQVLEIWPTPTTDADETHTLYYRAVWNDASDDDAIVFVPPFAEPLLMELCRTFARGWEGEDQATLSDRLANVQSGPLFAAAVFQDNRHQQNFGPMRGGLLDVGRGDPEYLDSFPVSIV